MIGEQLRALREERGWKREKVAGESGVSLGTIARFENGRYPQVENLIQIADCLEVSLDELVGRKAPRRRRPRRLRQPPEGSSLG